LRVMDELWDHFDTIERMLTKINDEL
jgi:hypothetical protein